MLSEGQTTPGNDENSRETTVRWIALGVAMILANATTAEPQTTLALCDSHNPPVVEGKEDGSVATGGRVVALLEEAFKRIDGADVEIRLMPWVRCLNEAKMGRQDGVAKLFKNKEREEYLEFSTEPVYVMENRVFYLEERFPDGLTWETLDDLSKYRVGIAEGSSYGAAADEAIRSGVLKAESVPSDVQNMTKLLAGRLDLVFNDAAMGATHARDAGGEGRIKSSEQALSTDEAYLGLSKKSESLDLLPAIDRALRELRQEGVAQRLLEGGS